MCYDHVGDIGRQQTPLDARNNNIIYDVKFLSQNVKGLGDDFKRRKVFNNFKDKANVIFVQESHSTVETKAKWNKMWNGTIKYSHGTSASRGCMIMFKDTLEYEVIDTKSDVMGRYVMVKCIVQGQKMFLVNVYAPNREKEHSDFLIKLIEDTKAFYDEEFYHIVFGGDWNFVDNLEKDKKGGIRKLWDKSITHASKLKDCFDLVDIWRLQN